MAATLRAGRVKKPSCPSGGQTSLRYSDRCEKFTREIKWKWFQRSFLSFILSKSCLNRKAALLFFGLIGRAEAEPLIVNLCGWFSSMLSVERGFLLDGPLDDHSVWAHWNDNCCLKPPPLALSMETVNNLIHPLFLCPSTTAFSIPLAVLRSSN